MDLDIQNLRSLAQAAVSPDSLEPVQIYRHEFQPAVALELIKQIEMLRKGWYENEFTDLKFWPEELEDLKAENERSTVREIQQLAEIEALRRALTTLRNHTGVSGNQIDMIDAVMGKEDSQ